MIVVLLAAVTIVYGSVMAVREHHLKRRLAYSTISNLSYILLGAALMTPAGLTGALTHMIFHGVIKIVLFFCVGAIMVKTEQEYVQEARGFAKIMPRTLLAFTIAALALVGMPPLPGFTSKWNLATAAVADGQWFSWVGMGALIVSAVLTAIYLFTVIVPAYMMPVNHELNSLADKKHDPGMCMKLPFALLIAAIFAMSVYSFDIVEWLSSIANGLF
jgi:multicomponent Na+:H+ antiporter subunit D